MPRATVQRSRRGAAGWIVEVGRGRRRVFDSRSLALQLKTERAARWLATLVETAVRVGVLGDPDPSAAGHRTPVPWTKQGDPSFDDESLCAVGRYAAHVEWLDGPMGEGGDYFLGVWTEGGGRGPELELHTGELYDDLVLRSADTARFLAELLIHLALAGVAVAPMSSSGA